MIDIVIDIVSDILERLGVQNGNNKLSVNMIDRISDKHDEASDEIMTSLLQKPQALRNVPGLSISHSIDCNISILQINIFAKYTVNEQQIIFQLITNSSN